VWQLTTNVATLIGLSERSFVVSTPANQLAMYDTQTGALAWITNGSAVPGGFVRYKRRTATGLATGIIAAGGQSANALTLTAAATGEQRWAFTKAMDVVRRLRVAAAAARGVHF
jgi:hypothetical protein